MTSLIVLLKLALVAYGIYSAVMYFSRRSDNKTALQTLKESSIIRELTAAEALVLNPFLLTAGIAANSDLSVRSLVGQFVRHGLYGSSSHSEHNTIGGVDVSLPYDAMDYVEDFNQCEVVVANNFALVVKINGFSLTEGRERSLVESSTEPDVIASESKVLDAGYPDVVRPTAIATPQTAAARTEARYRAGEADDLGDRLESPEEVAMRRSGSGWDGIWRCAAAFGLIWAASWDIAAPVRTLLLVIALLMLLWSVWCLARKPAKSRADNAPQRVQRVRGVLRQIAMVSANNHHISDTLFLGDSIQLKLPSHWNIGKLGPRGRVIDADVRTSDHQVLGLGPRWSITDESRRFPQVVWGRYLSFFLVALVALIFVWINSPPPTMQARMAWRFLTDAAPLRYSSVSGFVNHPPLIGDRVEIAGSARCEMTESGDKSSKWFLTADCLTVRWGGEAPRVPDLGLAPALEQLTKHDFLISHTDQLAQALATMMAQLQPNVYSGRDPTLYLNHGAAPQVISDLARTLKFVDEACAQGLPDCELLRLSLLAILKEALGNDENKTDFTSWESLVASAKSGNATVRVASGVAEKLRNAAYSPANDQVIARVSELVPGVLQSQRGGVLMHVTSPLWQDNLYGVDPVTKSSGDASQYWSTLKKLSTNESTRGFVLAGTVAGFNTANDGTPSLALNLDANPNLHSLAVVYTLWWGVAGVIMVLALAMTIWRFRLSSARDIRLTAEMTTRPPAGEAAIF